MRLMITNDDGFEAPGLQTLASVLTEAGHEVVVVAPFSEQSAKSHGMTFGKPLLTKEAKPGVFWVDGTPADCVAVGLAGILKDHPPEFVISGINNGLNVGQDINYSGTVAAAFEAAQIGCRSIAVSMTYTPHPSSAPALDAFTRTARFVARSLPEIDATPWPEWTVLNINHPSGETKSVCATKAHLTAIFSRDVQKIDIAGTGVRGDCLYVLGGEVNTKFPDQDDDVCRISQGHISISLLNCARGLPPANHGLKELAMRLSAR